MPIVKVAFLGIVAVVLASVLKKEKPEFQFYIILGASLFIFSLILSNFASLAGIYREFEAGFGEYKEYLGILLKVMGITYICDFSAGICKDAGHQTIAGQIELCAKVSIFLTGLPILLLLLEYVRGYFA